jgi:hypothetical protein
MAGPVVAAAAGAAVSSRCTPGRAVPGGAGYRRAAGLPPGTTRHEPGIGALPGYTGHEPGIGALPGGSGDGAEGCRRGRSCGRAPAVRAGRAWMAAVGAGEGQMPGPARVVSQDVPGELLADIP